jgi:hypothetical protein
MLMKTLASDGLGAAALAACSSTVTQNDAHHAQQQAGCMVMTRQAETLMLEKGAAADGWHVVDEDGV